MNIKSIGQELAKIGLPLLGAALPLPGGAAIGSALAALIGGDGTAADILAKVQSSVTALQQAQQFEATHQETLLRIQVDADVATTQAIAQTMQTEAGSEHWPTYSWRPYLGAVGGTVILWSYCIASWFGIKAEPIDPQVWLFLTAVLGVASYFRGKAQAASNSDTRG